MRLLALKSGPEIMKLLNSLEAETKALIEDTVAISIYSGQSYEQVWNLCHDEKKIFLKVLKEKLSIDRGIKPKDTLTQELI
jgi:hypothetical protein